MSYRSVLRLLPLAFICVTALGITYTRLNNAPKPAPRQERPNILVFVADDAGWRDFGAYGNDAIRTPRIDRLASTGLQVERAFLTISQCSPSRISILTGKYPHATGAEDLHMNLPDSLRILPSYLSEVGYYTGIMRKRHLGPHGNEQFDWYDPGEAPGGGPDFSAFDEFLGEAERREQPFFAWIGFRDPHRTYQEGTIGRPHEPAAVSVPPYLADTPETRRDMARYYDEIARMDQNIGRMMDMLEERGMRDSTLVVFLSDNGAPFPRSKGTVYDAGIRTPLIFSWPSKIEGGQTYDDGLVSVIDLAPTLLEVAGADAPENMQGESMARLLEEPASYEGREYVFSERNWHDCDEHIRAVRTERFKLIHNEDYTELPACTAADVASGPSWFSLKRLQEEGELSHAQARLFEAPRASAEFYDLQEDPWEVDNVADEAAYRDEAFALAKVLDQWEKRTGDFPPWKRKRADFTDRVTGMHFVFKIPPMRNDVE